ncbi:hypothetical protein VC_A0462 [Vibrio cholerae O1 biovar El Tor str. N16961]|uniref:Uncharacterized protein n=2 Tax=Vibrio cholerae TaxID=666 RepID=Q9KMB1_VIBCH|nr:hypothetical protein VC_A0462 [Vibrio cholerae O1 biovar El Tor str. N16961]ACP07389.1 hypothetical protein VCM66_A0422 [Vibrio cholerae M66-2]ACP11292.1 hypothetical protein VC395_A0455 [Vibrio cholerae O395]ACQ62836.1 hypothetical protein VCD_000876 [Vibrio cholerae MJ-1236]EEO18392.1 hypothetical protein VCE_000905 [Vibrio cholerae B33]EEO21631.1 hypothetical protein VCF_001578 [Vibrio cholerae BX 330286]
METLSDNPTYNMLVLQLNEAITLKRTAINTLLFH